MMVIMINNDDNDKKAMVIMMNNDGDDKKQW